MQDESTSLSKVLFKLVKNGRVHKLESLLHKSTSDNCGETESIGWTAASVYLLATTVDGRGRRLLHSACSNGRLKMLRYLISLDLPVEVFDKKGNSPAHYCVFYGIKNHCFSTCCKLLVCLLERNRELLYIRNNGGVPPSTLLESLWQSSSERECQRGDEILSNFRGLEDDIFDFYSSTHEDQNETSPEASEKFWNQHLIDEMIHDQPSYDNYFSGFNDPGTAGDNFEDIRREYERNRRSQYQRPVASNLKTSSSRKVEEERLKFNQRHSEGLKKRGFLFTPAPTRDSKLGDFLDKWKVFLSDTGPITASNVEKIPWLPVQDNKVSQLLLFVNNNFASLRQLQVDWHPDRFFLRLTHRIAGDGIRKIIADRVNSISQLLNSAVYELRQQRSSSSATNFQSTS